ncbi:MAG TPA: hypothetical protein VMS22_00745 [Candidatus Eisenbacteria bacterium]|nr:hypothetical protein [Candidatus Eisenbacteria bacterium]
MLANIEKRLGGMCGVEKRFAAAYEIVVPVGSTTQIGMPSCASTPPVTTSDAQGWLATAESSVWLQTSLSQVARNVDPQAWSTGCGHLVFHDTHIAKHASGGGFTVDPTTCTANAGTPHTLGTKWHDDLFEHFVPATYVPSFFKNILSIDVLQAPPGPAYKMTYSINTGLQFQGWGVPTPPCGTSGVYIDQGGITAIDAGNGWEYVVATKQLAFSEHLPNPPLLAQEAAVGLHALLDMMPFLVCCPAGFP